MRRLAILMAVVCLCLAGCDSGGTARSSSRAASSVAPPVTSTQAATSPPPVVTSTHRVKPSHKPSPTATRDRTSASPPAPVSSGTTVVLNPGHDGGDGAHPTEINRQVPAGYGAYKACDTTGTNTDAGYPEHAFTFDVALRVRTILRGHGVRVVLTRSNDTGVGPCVDERAAIGNEPGVAAVVSIHADGAPSSGHGFHVNQASRTPDGATVATAQQSDRLGQDIHATLVSSSGLVPSTYIGTNGYYYRSDLAGLNLARKPTTFLELGNMRNAGDAALLSSAAGRARIAAAIAGGILDFVGR